MKKKKQLETPVEKKEEFKLTFNLGGINILSFEYNPPKELILPLPAYKFQIIVKHGLDDIKKIVIVFVVAIIKNLEETEVLGKMEVAYTFPIVNFEEVIQTDTENHVLLDTRVLHTLNSIAISTTRGIAFAKFKDTAINNAIMPIYDLTQLTPLILPDIPTNE